MYFLFQAKTGDSNTCILKYTVFDIRIQCPVRYFDLWMVLTDDVERLSLFQKRLDKKSEISDFIDCSVDTCTCITEQFSIFFLCSRRIIHVLVKTAAPVSFAAVACARRAVTSFTDKRLERRTVHRTVARILVRTFSGINALDRILGFVRESAMIFDFLANCRFVFAKRISDGLFRRIIFNTALNDLQSLSVKCKFLFDVAMV